MDSGVFLPPRGWTRHNGGLLVLPFVSDIVNRKEIAGQLQAMCFGTGSAPSPV